jgi:hypothetical protein
MSTVHKNNAQRSIENLEAAIDSGQDISDTYFSPGGVSAGRTIGKRREPEAGPHQALTTGARTRAGHTSSSKGHGGSIL